MKSNAVFAIVTWSAIRMIAGLLVVGTMTAFAARKFFEVFSTVEPNFFTWAIAIILGFLITAFVGSVLAFITTLVSRILLLPLLAKDNEKQHLVLCIFLSALFALIIAYVIMTVTVNLAHDNSISGVMEHNSFWFWVYVVGLCSYGARIKPVDENE